MQQLMQPRTLRATLGISKSTEYDRQNPNSPRYDPHFPKPVKVGNGARATRYVSTEVEAYIERCIAARPEPKPTMAVQAPKWFRSAQVDNAQLPDAHVKQSQLPRSQVKA